MSKLLGGILCAVLAATAAAQTNYLSVQHPDWPPLPGPPSDAIELFVWEPGVVVMDDTAWHYPRVPAFTNALPKFSDPAAGFSFNTNLLARRPQDLEFFKESMATLTRTNGAARGTRLMLQRRQAAAFAELERVAAWGRAHPQEAARLVVLDGDGRPLPESVITRTHQATK